jgi:hypothetical protein
MLASDPPASFKQLLERDAQFADQVAREARDLGLKVVVVDELGPWSSRSAEVDGLLATSLWGG